MASMINAESSQTLDTAENIPLYPRSGGQHGTVRSFASLVRRSRDVIVVIIACIGAMSMGFSLGYSSPALSDPQLGKMLDTAARRSWFGSLVTVGAMFGGPLGAAFVGRCGRKTTLILCNVPLAIGWFLIIYAKDTVLLYCGRLLTGIGIGAVSMVAPLYVAEVAAVSRRGPLGTGFQLLVALGIFLSYAVGSAVSWSWLAVTGAGLCFLHVVLLLIVPETPRYLLVKRDRQGALLSLMWLRGSNEVDTEFNEIETAVNEMQESASSGLSIRDLLCNSRVLKPLFLSIALMFFQQASGVNAVIFYTSQIFRSAGFTADPSTPTMIVGAVLVAATAVSCIIADVAGRRKLLLSSGILMTLSIAALGVYFFLTEKQEYKGLGWLSLVSLLVYVAFFSIGWGPLPWLITAEILPVRAKGFAGGIATGSNWLVAFLTTKEFEDLETLLGKFGAFWLFASICLVGVIFVFFCLPETKGKSLEEIEAEFAARH